MIGSPSHTPKLLPKTSSASQAFTSLSLHTKLILAFLMVTVLAVSAVAFFSNRTTSAELTTQAGNTLHQDAATQAQAVGDMLAAEVDTLQAFGLNKFLHDQVQAVNVSYIGDQAAIQAQIQALDQQWVAASDNDPLIQNQLHNPVSVELQKYRSAFPGNVEVFVTDKYGANIAVSNRTSDYFQADEAWWQAAWNQGRGAVYIGQPSFDESSHSFAIVIAVPLYSQNPSAVIGILRTTYRLDPLIETISNMRIGTSGRAQLFLPGGQFITPDRTVATLDAATVAQFQGISAGAVDMLYQGKPSFVSPAPITTSLNNPVIAGLGWQLVVFQARAESLQPANSAVQTTLLVAAGVLVLAGLLGVSMAHVISAPLSRLTQIAQQIAQGDLARRLHWPQRDEIGLLAQSFDTMAENLEARFTEQQTTYAALVAQHSEQQRLLDLIADLETPIIPLGRGVLLAPLVGSLDARRMEAAGSSILQALTEQRARKVILDLTGVALTDSAVVQQLLGIVKCVRLLGAEALFTGMRGDTALLLVQLGIDVQEFQSTATLEAGIESVLNIELVSN